MLFRKLTIVFILFIISAKTYTQVNLQTGAAEYSLPIFSFADQNQLSTQVALNYIDGNGLKVSEVASSVGTGWHLQYGGVIIREQRGLPDDQRRSLTLPNPLPPGLLMSNDQYLNTYFPNGYLFSYYNPANSIPNEGGYIKMINSNLNWMGYAPESEFIAADREQDIFKLDFGKGIVEFVIAKNLQVKILNNSRIKVEVVLEDMLSQNIKTCITKFIVTDLEGIQYVFSGKELSRLYTYDIKKRPDNLGYITEDEVSDIEPYPPMPNPIPYIRAYIGKQTQNWIVTKWYLSEIKNPRTNKKIEFTYENYDLDMRASRLINVVEDQTITHLRTSVVIRRESLKALRIKKITCDVNSTVDFVYEEFPRIDVPDDKPLKEIQVKENNTLIKTTRFEYGYFFTSLIRSYNYVFAANEKFLTRLCLKSIQSIGSNNSISEPPYLFDYYTGTGYPDISGKDIVPSMFTYWTDHWGYFNILNFSRAQVALFEYPRDRIPLGYVEAECMTNANKAPYAGMAKNGIIKEIKNPLGGSITFGYEQNEVSYNGQNLPSGGVRVKTITRYNGIDHNNDEQKEYKYTTSNGITSSGWGYENPLYSLVKYKRVFKQTSNKKILSGFSDFAMGSITNYMNLWSWMYINYTTFCQNQDNQIIQLALSIIVNILFDIFSTEFNDSYQIEYRNVQYQAGNPLPQQYSRVEVLDRIQNINNNGKIVYEFTSPTETPIDIPILNFPFSNKDRCKKGAYGLLKKTSIYNNANKLLKEEINEYNVYSSFLNNDINFMSKTWDANTFTFDGYPSSHTAYLAEYGNISESAYYPQVEQIELSSTRQRVYNENSADYAETSTSYTYNSNNYQPKTITTTNSKGHTIEKKFYYPEDYTYGGIINDLKNSNKVNTIVSSETWLTKPAGQAEMLSLSVTEFGIAPNNDIRPIKTYALQNDKPVPQGTIGVFDPNQLIRSNLIVPQTETIYNTVGNPIISKDLQALRNTSTFYSYNNKYPVADIKNAAANEVAYTSFEAFQLGYVTTNWDMISVTVLTEACPTGNSCLLLKMSPAISVVTALIPINEDYKLSFWATSTAFVVNNSLSPSLTGPTINGWTYYEFNIPTGSSSPVIKGNLCKIDELRLYPKRAGMVTATYEPGVGKTSECNMNNKINYYEYDGLGRINKIFDERHNIIKTYEYHFKN